MHSPAIGSAATVYDGALVAQLENDSDLCCPSCLDLYLYGEDKKEPQLLNCLVHDLCLACFEEFRVQGLTRCPIDNAPEDYTRVPKVSILKKQMVERAKEAFEKQGAPSAEAAKVEPADFSWKGASLAKAPETVCSRIQSVADFVRDEMKWGEALGACFPEDRGQWFILDDHDGYTHGFAQLVRAATRFFIKNAGVTGSRPPTASYTELIAQLLERVRRDVLATCPQISTNYLSNETQVTLEFDYDRDREFMRVTTAMLENAGWDWDAARYERSPGVLGKRIVIYPIARQGHPQCELKLDPGLRILDQEQLDAETQAPLNQMLDNGLSQLFRMCSIQQVPAHQCEEHAQKLTKSFLTAPERFLVYHVAGAAAGYVKYRYLRTKEKPAEIIELGLSQVNQRYHQHFLTSFFTQLREQQGHQGPIWFNSSPQDPWHGYIVEAAQAQEMNVSQALYSGDKLRTVLTPKASK